MDPLLANCKIEKTLYHFMIEFAKPYYFRFTKPIGDMIYLVSDFPFFLNDKSLQI